MESVPSSPGEGEGVWRVYHHLVKGGSVVSVPSSPGEGEGVLSVPSSPGEGVSSSPARRKII